MRPRVHRRLFEVGRACMRARVLSWPARARTRCVRAPSGRERPIALSALPKGSSHTGNSEREAARPGAGAARRRCGPAPVGPRIQARKAARPGAGARRGRRPGPAPLLASHSGQPVAGEGTQGSGRPPCTARWLLAPRLNVRRVRLARPGCPFPSRAFAPGARLSVSVSALDDEAGRDRGGPPARSPHTTSFNSIEKAGSLLGG
jgi:hypothetical protein